MNVIGRLGNSCAGAAPAIVSKPAAASAVFRCLEILTSVSSPKKDDRNENKLRITSEEKPARVLSFDDSNRVEGPLPIGSVSPVVSILVLQHRFHSIIAGRPKAAGARFGRQAKIDPTINLSWPDPSDQAALLRA
jgi:hypothetical protein